MRSLPVIIAGPLALVVVAGCSAGGAGDVAVQTRDVAVSATFGTTPESAITYQPDLVQVGARGAVSVESRGGDTTVRLAVRGLLPERTYGAHVHSRPCGMTGDDAGPHFQHDADPQQPSTDPRYANPNNEIWLDLTTDGQGSGSTQTTVPWQLTGERPNSVVIHADRTSTEPGTAGTAGPRVACINVDF